MEETLSRSAPRSRRGSEEDELSHRIIGCAIEVHKELGPGLFEAVYEEALAFELSRQGASVQRQVPIPIRYKGLEIKRAFKADLVVNDLVIIEVKSVRNIDDVHLKQLLTYLRLSGKRLGLLFNFNEPSLKDGLRRIVNGLPNPPWRPSRPSREEKG